MFLSLFLAIFLTIFVTSVRVSAGWPQEWKPGYKRERINNVLKDPLALKDFRRDLVRIFGDLRKDLTPEDIEQGRSDGENGSWATPGSGVRSGSSSPLSSTGTGGESGGERRGERGGERGGPSLSPVSRDDEDCDESSRLLTAESPRIHSHDQITTSIKNRSSGGVVTKHNSCDSSGGYGGGGYGDGGSSGGGYGSTFNGEQTNSLEDGALFSNEGETNAGECAAPPSSSSFSPSHLPLRQQPDLIDSSVSSDRHTHNASWSEIDLLDNSSSSGDVSGAGKGGSGGGTTTISNDNLGPFSAPLKLQQPPSQRASEEKEQEGKFIFEYDDRAALRTSSVWLNPLHSQLGAGAGSSSVDGFADVATAAIEGEDLSWDDRMATPATFYAPSSSPIPVSAPSFAPAPAPAPAHLHVPVLAPSPAPSTPDVPSSLIPELVACIGDDISTPGEEGGVDFIPPVGESMSSVTTGDSEQWREQQRKSANGFAATSTEFGSLDGTQHSFTHGSNSPTVSTTEQGNINFAPLTATTTFTATTMVNGANSCEASPSRQQATVHGVHGNNEGIYEQRLDDEVQELELEDAVDPHGVWSTSHGCLDDEDFATPSRDIGLAQDQYFNTVADGIGTAVDAIAVGGTGGADAGAGACVDPTIPQPSSSSKPASTTITLLSPDFDLIGDEVSSIGV